LPPSVGPFLGSPRRSEGKRTSPVGEGKRDPLERVVRETRSRRCPERRSGYTSGPLSLPGTGELATMYRDGSPGGWPSDNRRSDPRTSAIYPGTCAIDVADRLPRITLRMRMQTGTARCNCRVFYPLVACQGLNNGDLSYRSHQTSLQACPILCYLPIQHRSPDLAIDPHGAGDGCPTSTSHVCSTLGRWTRAADRCLEDCG